MLNDFDLFVTPLYLFSYFLNTIIWIYFIHNIFEKRYYYSHYISLFLFFIVIIINYVFIVNNVFLKSLLGILVIFISCLLFYNGSLFNKLLCPFFIIIAFAISEFLSVIFIVYGCHISYGNTRTFETVWVLLFNNIIAFFILKFLIKMLNHKISKKSNIYLLILILAYFPFSLILCFMFLFRYSQSQTMINIISIFLLVLFIFICDYFLFHEAIKLEKEKKLEITNNLINQFYLNIYQQSIKVKKDITDYRIIRHDLINYIEKLQLERKGENKS